MSKRKATPLNILKKIEEIDIEWARELKDNKSRIDAAIEIGKQEEVDDIIQKILMFKDGELEINLILQVLDKCIPKAKHTPDKIKAMVDFKAAVSRVKPELSNNKDLNEEHSVDEIIEDINDDPTDEDFIDPEPIKKKKKQLEITKIATTSRISDDNTPNDEKKKKISKMAIWKIDDADIPAGWYEIKRTEIKPILIVRSETMKPEQVKEMIQDIWMELPPNEGLIAAVFTGPDSCKIEALDDFNRNIIYKKLSSEYPELNVSYPNLRPPKIKLVNVDKPDKISWEKWLELTKKKNKWDELYVKILEHTKAVGEMKYTVYLEVDSMIRANIEDKRGAVPGPFGIAYAFDVLAITRCLNCISYSHWTRNCSAQNFCLRCSKNHKTYLCPRKEESHLWYCGGCNKRGHAFVSRKCPKFLKAIEIAIRQVNFVYGWIMAPQPSLEESI